MNPTSVPPPLIVTARSLPRPSMTVSAAPRYPIRITALLTVTAPYVPASTTTRSPLPETSSALWMSRAASAQLSYGGVPLPFSHTNRALGTYS